MQTKKSENVINNPFYFYGHTDKSGDSKCLSNWYPAKFVDENGNQFYHSEQYMMYQKAILFKDLQKAKEILETESPKIAKQKGRQVKNFVKEVWDANARDIVFKGCLLKFSQNEDMKSYLLSTGNRHLAEASPFDRIWGIGIGLKKASDGHEWRGRNWLGECLMKVRTTLNNS